MTHFTGALWPTDKARVAPLCPHNKQRVGAPVVQIARPPVGRIGAAHFGSGGSLRRLPDPSSAAAALPLRRVDALHRAAHRAYPGDPIRSHEMGHYL